MRDPLRIADVLLALGELWKLKPDTRLGQLIVNIVQPSEPCPEVFYIEDRELVKRLKTLAGQWKEELAQKRAD